MRIVLIFLCILCFPLTVCADTYCVVYNATDFGQPETDKIAKKWRNVCPKPVHLHYLPFKKCTNKNFMAEMDWLKKNVKKNDLVLLYIEGHGGNDNGHLNVGDNIMSQDLQKRLDALPTKTKILFIDACHSGIAIKEKWTETIVICASCEDEVSWSGIMGPATLAAFSRRADKDGNGEITVLECVAKIFAEVHKHNAQKAKAIVFVQNNPVVVGVLP